MEHLRKLAFALAFLTVVMSTVWTSAGALKVIRVASFLEDKLVTQDITDDPERNTVLIVVGEVTDIEDFKSTVNLHDFNTGYVALKDIADGTCLLKPIPFDKKEHIPGLRDYVNVKGTKVIPQQKKMYWDVDPKVLTYSDVKKQAGDTLAEFCRDYRSYNLVPKSSQSIGKLLNDSDRTMSNPEAGETVLTPVKRNCNAGKVPIRFKFLMAASISGAGSPRRTKRCTLFCGSCSNAIDGYEDDQIDMANID